MSKPLLPVNAIESLHLTKLYHKGGVKQTALKDFSLAIPRGSLFGLLGPNGAGKSTFINILAGLVVKTSGTARIWGIDIDHDHRRAKTCIGVVPQELNLDPFFTPRAILEFHAGLYGVPRRRRRTEQLLKIVGLADRGDAYPRTLSGGMRRRLMMAKAMVHAPPILILDEPTAGVDIELRRLLWKQLLNLKEEGATIVLTTHYLEEAETLCDRIAIVDQGRLIACDTTRALLERLDSKELHVVTEDDITKLPPTLAPYQARLADARHIVLRYAPRKVGIRPILAALQDSGLRITDLTTREADLQDVFLRLTRPADEGDEVF